MAVGPPLQDLQVALSNRELPGGEITIEGYESLIADYALRTDNPDSQFAHPIWFLICAIRGMGISIEQLSEMCMKSEADTLLFGECEIEQKRPLIVGETYRINATILDVERRQARDQSLLDIVNIQVQIHRMREAVGTVSNSFLFKRGRMHA